MRYSTQLRWYNRAVSIQTFKSFEAMAEGFLSGVLHMIHLEIVAHTGVVFLIFLANFGKVMLDIDPFIQLILQMLLISLIDGLLNGQTN